MVQLEYSITRPYPWTWYTPAALVGSLVVLLLITLVNVAAAGYETITILHGDFNFTQSFWWSPFDIHRNKPLCSPLQLSISDSFRTTNNIFTYTVESVQPTSIKRGPATAIAYNGHLLPSVCGNGIHAVSTRMNVRVHRQTRTVEGRTSLRCQLPDSGDAFIIGMQHVTTQFGQESSEPTSYRSGDNTTVYTLLGTMRMMGHDILLAINGNDSASIDILDATASRRCPQFDKGGGGEEQAKECMLGQVLLENQNQHAMYANGSVLVSTPFKPVALPAALNQSIDKYIQTMYAAVNADLGHWYNGSIFLAKDILNETITPADAVSSIVRERPDVIVSLGPEYENSTSSNAAHMRSREEYIEEWTETGIGIIPIPEDQRSSNATIATLYTCNAKRRKDVLSLVISVLVADLSMFGAFWGILTIVATMFAKRGKVTEANTCMAVSSSGGHVYSLATDSQDKRENL